MTSGDDGPLQYPEYPTWRDCSREVAEHAIGWLEDEGRRRQVVDRLVALREQYALGGASARAAEYIVRQLSPAQAGGVLPRAA